MRIRYILVVAIACFMPVQWCVAKDSTATLKSQERNTISLQLEFSRKNPGAFQRVVSFLNWEPNGYATGFLVGNGLVITAYHVVSGELDTARKLTLGFGAKDELEVKISINGCQAKVLRIDKEADLALLQVCGSSKLHHSPSFQPTVNKDEKLLMIARPRGEKTLVRGTFYGSYSFKGIEYWSVKITARDGFSGSPVYNEQGELVGVFSGYDWKQKLAVISPGARAQKLLEEFSSQTKR